MENFKWFLKYILEILQDAILIIAIVVLVRYFVISPFQVNWASMKETFHNWDYIFVEKLSYQFSEPKFWDIIIFTPPVPRSHQLTWIRCFIEHLNENDRNIATNMGFQTVNTETVISLKVDDNSDIPKIPNVAIPT